MGKSYRIVDLDYPHCAAEIEDAVRKIEPGCSILC